MGWLRYGRGQGPILWMPGLGGKFASFAVQTTGLVLASQLAPPLQLPFAITASPKAESEAIKRRITHSHPAIGSEAATPAQYAATPIGMKERSPIDFEHSRRVGEKEVSGPKRVTRHPALWAMGLVGAGTALSGGLATHVCFGAFPFAMAAIGGAHQDHRFRKSGALSPAVDAATSLFPFEALLAGRQSWAELGEEVAWVNAGLATAVGVGLAARRWRALQALMRTRPGLA